MTVRFFVLASFIMMGLVVNAVLIGTEVVPPSRTKRITEARVSELKALRYTKGERESNLREFGLPSRIETNIIKRIDKMERRDMRGDESLMVKSSLKQVKAGSLNRRDESTVFCPVDDNLKMDPPYAAVGVLLNFPEGASRPVPFTERELQQGLRIGYPSIESEMEDLYNDMELYPLRANLVGPVCVAVALVLLNEGATVRNGTIKNENDLQGTPPTCKFLIDENSQLGKQLEVYFANFLYLAELANDPGYKICGS